MHAPLPSGAVVDRRRRAVTATHRCGADRGPATARGRSRRSRRLQPTERFQFSKLNREPFGLAIAGVPGCRPSIRILSIGINRSGRGTERRPASDFGLPMDELSSHLGNRATDANSARIQINVLNIQARQLPKTQSGIRKDGHDVTLNTARLIQGCDFCGLQIDVGRVAHGWKVSYAMRGSCRLAGRRRPRSRGSS
jgi:hypothetical protein